MIRHYTVTRRSRAGGWHPTAPVCTYAIWTTPGDAGHESAWDDARRRYAEEHLVPVDQVLEVGSH